MLLGSASRSCRHLAIVISGRHEILEVPLPVRVPCILTYRTCSYVYRVFNECSLLVFLLIAKSDPHETKVDFQVTESGFFLGVGK